MLRFDRSLIAIAVLWLAVNITSLWYPTPDGCGYLSIAHSLAESGKLKNLGSTHVYYPLGYPVFLSPLFLLDQEPFLLISFTHFLLALGILRLVYVWVNRIAPGHAAWVCLLTVGTASFGNLYRRTLGETLFMLLWLGGGFAFDRLSRAGRGYFSSAALLSFLVLVRPAGAMLAGGFAVVLFITGLREVLTWRSVVLRSLVVLPAVIMQLTIMWYDRATAAVEGHPTYSQQFRDPTLSPAEQLVEGVRLRMQEAGRLLLPGMYKSYAKPGEWLNPNTILYVPLAIALLLGWWRQVARHREVLLWALPFYIALYVIWPFDQSTRFFMPMMPVFAVCLIALGRDNDNLARRIGITITILHFGVAVGHWLLSERPTAQQLDRSVPELRQIVERIPPNERSTVAAAESLGDDVIWLQFLLDREVVILKTTTEPQKVTQWLVLSATDPISPDWVEVQIGRYRLLRR